MCAAINALKRIAKPIGELLVVVVSTGYRACQHFVRNGHAIHSQGVYPGSNVAVAIKRYRERCLLITSLVALKTQVCFCLMVGRCDGDSADVKRAGTRIMAKVDVGTGKTRAGRNVNAAEGAMGIFNVHLGLGAETAGRCLENDRVEGDVATQTENGISRFGAVVISTLGLNGDIAIDREVATDRSVSRFIIAARRTRVLNGDVGDGAGGTGDIQFHIGAVTGGENADGGVVERDRGRGDNILGNGAANDGVASALDGKSVGRKIGPRHRQARVLAILEVTDLKVGIGIQRIHCVIESGMKIPNRTIATGDGVGQRRRAYGQGIGAIRYGAGAVSQPCQGLILVAAVGIQLHACVSIVASCRDSQGTADGEHRCIHRTAIEVQARVR